MKAKTIVVAITGSCLEIPAALRKAAGLKGPDCVLVGCGSHFEVYSPKANQKDRKRSAAVLRRMSKIPL